MLLVRDSMSGTVSNPWLLQLGAQVSLILTVWHNSQHGLSDVAATLACLHSLFKLAAIGIMFRETVERPDWLLVAGLVAAMVVPTLGRSGRNFQQAWGGAVVITEVFLGVGAKVGRGACGGRGGDDV